jgi:hypothetical protein
VPSSTAENVDRLLTDLEAVNPAVHALMQALRAEVKAALPQAVEQVKYGGLLFAPNVAAQPIGGLFAYQSHVTLEFSQGARLPDPQRQLLGAGKYRRHLRFELGSAVDPQLLTSFVAAAAALAAD